MTVISTPHLFSSNSDPKRGFVAACFVNLTHIVTQNVGHVHTGHILYAVHFKVYTWYTILGLYTLVVFTIEIRLFLSRYFYSVYIQSTN